MLLDDVCKRFKEIELHDSRLIGLTIERRGREPISDVHLTLSLQGGVYPDYHWTDAQLVFIDCTYLKIEIDQTMLHAAADAINGTECLNDSTLRRELEAGVMKYENAPLSEYLEFMIGLCPPAGELHFFARDFRLETPPR